MTAFQMIIVGLGVLLGGSTFWGQIKGISPKILKRVKDEKKEDVPTSEKNDHPEVCPEDSLCTVVSRWEDLRNQLVNRGLTEAISELDKIFPLFVVKDGAGHTDVWGLRGSITDTSSKDVQGNVEL